MRLIQKSNPRFSLSLDAPGCLRLHKGKGVPLQHLLKPGLRAPAFVLRKTEWNHSVEYMAYAWPRLEAVTEQVHRNWSQQ